MTFLLIHAERKIFKEYDFLVFLSRRHNVIVILYSLDIKLVF
ncbi:MAG TPA: hypothetical protein DEB17_02515 [Chlorobaculum sp.]|uniref:Uncharacterized protein n=1 Tax=Chlorobaculum tepidum (strain ATCC 49652 / DSM 12025 / NBRC 103806 / TLS) TaxID=194439 RepID=Q8KEH6_CHLTE|nr:hypothetical protein CT0713 [Chlorobaculum tepidum TLS]HBU22870.1 hypothetical protein [Chlorobaculum sp.]